MRKFVGRYRLGLAVAAAFIVLLAAGVVVSAWEAVRARRAEAEVRAVNEFLQNDVLAQASASTQAAPNTKPNPDLKVRTALDRAAARIEGKFAGQPLVEASIRQTIGTTYLDLSLFLDAERQFERALKLRQRFLGDKSRDTLSSMSGVARALERQGKFAEAEPLQARVLEVQRRVLGEEDPNTLSSLHSLAVILRWQK
jgi:hypothetical protein